MAVVCRNGAQGGRGGVFRVAGFNRGVFCRFVLAIYFVLSHFDRGWRHVSAEYLMITYQQHQHKRLIASYIEFLYNDTAWEIRTAFMLEWHKLFGGDVKVQVSAQRATVFFFRISVPNFLFISHPCAITPIPV